MKSLSTDFVDAIKPAQSMTNERYTHENGL